MNYLIILYIVSIFNVFYLTPVSIFADVYIQAFSLLGIFTIFSHRYYKQKSTRYLIFSLIVLIISSVFSSILFLNQDGISALIATQNLFKGFSVFYFVQNIKSNKIDLTLVLKSLIRIVWFFTIFLTFASLTKFVFTFISPVSGNQLQITADKYSKDLLYLGEMYFLAKYFKTGKFINIIYLGLIFTSTQLYDIQRGDFIFMIAILIICLFLYRKYFSSFKIYLIAPIFIVLLINSFNNSEIKSNITNKFGQMLMVFNAEESGKIDDASIFVRLKEIDFAVNGFMESPISGKGLIRSSKQKDLIGDVYFYTGDIGIYGILFTFGIIGMVILSYYVIWAIKIKYRQLNIVFSGFYIYTIYILLYTLKDGFIMFNITQFIFCVLITKLSLEHSLEHRNHVSIAN
jgi:hypothetical protein